MGEKWFEFVKRIKKEGNYGSLSEAMKAASKRKSEWKKDGAAPAGAAAASPMAKSSGKKTKKARKSRKSKKSRKSRKSKKR